MYFNPPALPALGFVLAVPLLTLPALVAAWGWVGVVVFGTSVAWMAIGNEVICRIIKED